jgi:hypothetical protein
LERLNGSVAGQGAGDGSAVCLRDVRGQPGATVRRDSFASIGEHPPTVLALLGQPFAIAGPARPLQRTGACLLRVLEAMINLRVLIESV